MNVRPATYAGSWYPDTAAECKRQIKAFLAEKVIDPPAFEPCGAIVPHAGWVYSGGIACRALSLLKGGRMPDTVVIFGQHLYPKSSPRILPEGGMATPLGVLAVDEDLAGKLMDRFAFQAESVHHFAPDNTIELQLPFIKYFFPDAKIVPVGVPPDAMAVEIGRFAVQAAHDLGLCLKVAGSTDLTHYGAHFGLTHYGFGEAAHRQVRDNEDRRIIERMLAMDPHRIIEEALSSHNACCSGAVAAAIAAGREMGAATAAQTEYATSYDKSPGDSFVGYAGIVF
ncbi:MAG: AmmeMemoRadiSam system protein B [Thermodesulfobacteriota bacterium]